ncbi:TerY-C metal binding domain-containing protein [Endozoicomonas ascidiicola]|uniref:TerY-C metal binding domain-containing protein n=1 Tax=Endozoicomonas ascidiicola TaxID=1698521 RepID=UPI000AED87FD|nr:TerY-C metal binding domain-containing protein [Endozoicomonas ascidiicola]USN26996.1 VWA domain-containing protein [synthetic construct]
MMRRLPVYFLLDVSESMLGLPLRQLETGMEQIIRSLRTDPQALESVYLSVVAFAGKADVIVPLIDVVSFYPPRLPVGSGTALGAALNCLMDNIEKDVVKTTTERRGDWKPVIFLMTDGRPTDNTDEAVRRWNTEFAHRAQLVAITLGDQADTSVLSKMTDDVLCLEGNDGKTFKQFIDWISASVTATSYLVESNAGAGVSLAKKPTGLTLVKDFPVHTASAVDESVVVLTGRCQKSERPYLIKYNRSDDAGFGEQEFELEGAFPIEESFFAWSAIDKEGAQVNTDQLIGVPACPHCGNGTAFAMCSCGGLLCTDGAGPYSCPWCKTEGMFSEGSDGDFDVTRGMG